MPTKKKAAKHNLRTAAGRAAHATEWAKTRIEILKVFEEAKKIPLSDPLSTAYWKVGV